MKPKNEKGITVMRKNYFILLLLLAFFIGLFVDGPQAALAKSKLDEIKERGKIIV